ncbi:eukaryotic translation initiation factor 3 subunit J [Kipferlia bialata]|uniref:Eukaryotic translation initiation factor 3 subunit J n=1 Tax=Kipferlia bialata TaxID=797122 RepID=A0A9K3DA03_9EUKA|nr:eukaryotic translation initiation factor 3 subunit J [Kipferlia bialata]|eukprot:g12642.t1
MKAKNSIDAFVPRSYADFMRLAAMIVDKLKAVQDEDTVLYLECLKAVVKGSLDEMWPEDAKEVAAVAELIASDKIKAERVKRKGRKVNKVKVKPGLRMNADEGSDDMDGDMDGFM